jgi:hypothetical protein
MELKAKEIAESFNGEPMIFEVIEALRVYILLIKGMVAKKYSR